MSEEMYTIPAETDIEEQVLARMLTDVDAIGEVAGLLQPGHFYTARYRKLYQEVLERWEKDAKAVNMADMMPTMEKLGIDVMRLTNLGIDVATWEMKPLAERLIRVSDMRAAMKIAHEILRTGHMSHMLDQEDIQKAIADASESLSKIGESQTKNTMRSIHDILMEYTDEVENTLWSGAEGEQTAPGLLSGMIDLDKLTNGYQAPELIVVAARPSMGKTAFALQKVLNISERYHDKGEVAIFSLEMSAKALVNRMLANLGNLSGLGTRKLTEEEYSRFTIAVSLLASRNITIDDEAGQTVAKIKAKARRLKQEKGLAAVFIDYLQFIEPPKGMNRYEGVSYNTKALKNMAKELNVPVIALSQVGRQVEQRADKRPMMSDLRESGEIEQTADKIMFLYRDDYYNKDSEKKNIVEVDLAKHRDGATGKVELAFLKEYGKFRDLEAKRDEEQMACF
ncbi:replicative DNA helicase [Aneurinibacillus thermoaerophilus]|uniref:replicative DNA helicase n=1 Tax=Aneurinibacillus thermoaerophilus TaxID=143495 RepID=UPI002E1D264C|nr:replicative DNA helicase [Aneurinibacillus thermoaerophilus]MED0761074.1 replicative DNA helicase [Aneurinibacillus thermoaerophilus]